MNDKRARVIKPGVIKAGPVIYWMSRDQRVKDHWALLHAQKIALENSQPLICIFCLVPQFLGATVRQYGFMLKGLVEVAEALRQKNIPLEFLFGEPSQTVPKFLKQYKAGNLISDFDPLWIKQKWKKQVAAAIDIPFGEVDSHNIIPCWQASPKLEYGAYTLRPKIHRVLSEYLTEFPELKKQAAIRSWKKGEGGAGTRDLAKMLRRLKADRSVGEVKGLIPGEAAAQKALKDFVSQKLAFYDERRSDPNLDGQSNLSPYLHFGQLSAQRVALAVAAAQAPESAKDAFLEELIVRRELSDNFCSYQKDYDQADGLPAWARKTLREHQSDKRSYIYSRKQFEFGQTHDELWNAAQMEMVTTGKMHGYMRMYWAKKILEWTPSAKAAFKTAIYLNDRYQLDGRDPNGYAGIAWSLGGVHDRAWGERAVFGKIRYMSYNGCKSKFDVAQYIATHRSGSVTLKK